MPGWRPCCRGHQPTLPTGIELSADAAQLAGGVLRHFRTGFEVGTNGVTLREAEAVLPGNATFHLTGQLAAGRFAGDARLVRAQHGADAGLVAPTRPGPGRRAAAGCGAIGHAQRRRGGERQ